MSVDTTPVGRCVICENVVIVDEPYVACDEQGRNADYADTELLRHSGCSPKALNRNYCPWCGEGWPEQDAKHGWEALEALRTIDAALEKRFAPGSGELPGLTIFTAWEQVRRVLKGFG